MSISAFDLTYSAQEELSTEVSWYPSSPATGLCRDLDDSCSCEPAPVSDIWEEFSVIFRLSILILKIR